jgi:hypothetical protein
MLGALGPTGLARAYAAGDIVAVPSREEGYGIAATEALRCGLPIVASDIPALRASCGVAATFIRADDDRALAQALLALVDPLARERLARQARRAARRLPTWAETERSFVRLVEAELQSSRSGGERMPPRGVTSPKRKRQYEKIKKSVRSRGGSEGTAKRIAAATTNKTRRRKGETKSRRRSSR